MGVGLEGLA